MKKLFLSFTALSLVIASCTKTETKRTEHISEIAVSMEKNDFVNIENSRRQYNAHGGEYYSGVDSIQVYGGGYVKRLEDSLKNYNLDLVVSGWLREIKAPCEGYIAVSLVGADGSIKDWNGVNEKKGKFTENQWFFVTDTFHYNKTLLNTVSEVKVFAMKPNGADMFDMDDLKVKYIFYK